MRRRAGFSEYSGLADDVAEPVVDVVHPHQGRRREGVLDHGLADGAPGVREDGLEQAGVARRGRRSDRDAPALPGGEAPVGEHRLEVQLDVPGEVREGLPDRLDAVVGTGGRHATSSVASPFFQLQGQSSSVCRASRTRRTSSTLRPTERSLTLT